MAAYMIALTDLADTGWIEEYRSAVPAMIARHGGEYVANGLSPELIEGAMPVPDAVTMFRFPSVAAIKAFLASEEYRPYKALRDTGAAARILVFESDI